MIKQVLHTILPGDKGLELPSASELDFDSYQENELFELAFKKFLEVLSLVSREKFQSDFVDLNDKDRMSAINHCKIKDFRVFSNFIEHCFRFYYSDIKVLSVLDVGSVPPFPRGNALNKDNWEILKPVLERGYVCAGEKIGLIREEDCNPPKK